MRCWEAWRAGAPFVAAVALFVAACVSGWWALSGVTAHVTNSEQVTLRDVRITYEGGSTHLGDLRPGQTSTVRFRPGGRTTVRVSYNIHGRRESHSVRPQWTLLDIAEMDFDLAGGL
ncbi:MAG: hypothetical protein ACOC7T_02500 [Planctomycetota bacterium]